MSDYDPYEPPTLESRRSLLQVFDRVDESPQELLRRTGDGVYSFNFEAIASLQNNAGVLPPKDEVQFSAIYSFNLASDESPFKVGIELNRTQENTVSSPVVEFNFGNTEEEAIEKLRSTIAVRRYHAKTLLLRALNELDEVERLHAALGKIPKEPIRINYEVHGNTVYEKGMAPKPVEVQSVGRAARNVNI